MGKVQRVLVVLILAALSLSAVRVQAQDNRTVIKMWHLSTPADSFSKVLPPAIEKFNQENKEFRIDAQAIENEAFKTQLQIAASAGNQPDVFQTWGGGTLQAYIKAGVAAEIPELNGDKRFIAGALGPSTFDGKHYAVPANLAASVMWVNKDLFSANKVEIPTNWTQFLAACKTFKDKGVLPMTFGNKERWPGSHWFAYLVTRLGGSETFVKAVNREIPFTDPVFVEAGKRLQEAVKAGCFGEGSNGVANNDSQALMATGGAAMRQMGDWDLGSLKDINAALVDKAFAVMPFPAIENGKGTVDQMMGGTGQALAISTKAPKGTGKAIVELLGSEYFGKLAAEQGFLPALVGYDQYLKEPLKQQIAALMAKSTFIQLWWDQFLSPAMAQVHLDTVQQLLGLQVTPEQAAKTVEDLAVKEIGPLKK
jgi:raffinose/stachyose/melibiose transport system substrate-binding protein